MSQVPSVTNVSNTTRDPNLRMWIIGALFATLTLVAGATWTSTSSAVGLNTTAVAKLEATRVYGDARLQRLESKIDWLVCRTAGLSECGRLP